VQIDIPRAQDDANQLATVANIFYISSGAVAIGAVVVFILAAQQKPKPKKITNAHPLPSGNNKTVAKSTHPQGSIFFTTSP
jgi:hypothetical protein